MMRVWTILLSGWLIAGPATAELLVSPAAWDDPTPLGSGTVHTQSFSIANPGDQPVTIQKVVASSMFTCDLPRKTIAPGDKVTLFVVLTPPPAGPAGAKLRESLVVFLKDSVETLTIPVQLNVTGAVAPPGEEALLYPDLEGRYKPRPGDQPVTATVFYDSECSTCLRFRAEYVDPLTKHFQGSKLTVEAIDYSSKKGPSGLNRLLKMKADYGIKEKEGKVFAFVGHYVFTGQEEVTARMYEALLSELQSPTERIQAVVGAPTGPLAPGGPPGPAGPPAPAARPEPAPQPADETSAIEDEFAGYSYSLLLGAGFVDGLNPCAFATAVFLVALLTRLGHDRRSLLGAGLGFTAAVGLTYYLLGLGVVRSIELFGDKLLTARVINGVVGAVALVFAGLQVRDVLRLRGGAATREMTMQTPLRVKQWIHRFMREGLSRPTVVVGAAVAGALVTLLEAVCTGQVYIPVLSAVAAEPELRGRAHSLLGVYCLGFVAPLVVVLIAAFKGVSSDALAAAARRHLVPAKLALAALLAALGVWLLAIALG